ncbi:uncharacterized protein [Desmodus rotundus]|uniref:uncharacterized protein n=1 Tax=Desmodus rotundus TaxID=9430 RepID=UPI0039E40A41
MQVTFCQTPEPWARPWAPPAPSSSILLFCRALVRIFSFVSFAICLIASLPSPTALGFCQSLNSSLILLASVHICVSQSLYPSCLCDFLFSCLASFLCLFFCLCLPFLLHSSASLSAWCATSLWAPLSWILALSLTWRVCFSSPPPISINPTGFTTYPAQRWLCCYPCSFAKPCHPVPTECQDDEACGIGIGTSEQGETIQRKGCLPRALCSLPGHATYWSHSHVLQPGPVECGRHAAATPQPPPHLPAPHGRLYLGRQPPLPASLRCAAFDPGLLHITVARKTPAQTLLRYSQEPDFVQRPQTPGLTPLQTPSRHDSYGYCSSPCSHLPRAPPYQKHLFCVFRLFWVTVTDALS